MCRGAASLTFGRGSRVPQRARYRYEEVVLGIGLLNKDGLAVAAEVEALTIFWVTAREHDRESDQSFTSGALRDLRDSSREEGSSYGLDLQFSWDLAKRAEPADLIAVSRERRELIELRDQVLERVNRLYYERLKVLAQHATAAPEQRAGLDLRARELGSQLDAWTGGTFSRLAGARSNVTPEWRTTQ